VYAKDHELGIDTTMRMLSAKEGQIPTYDYTIQAEETDSEGTTVVKKHVYRTASLINYDGAKSLKGSGTRMWEANEVIDGKVDMTTSWTLKDCWIDEGRISEGETYDRIRNQPGMDKDDQQFLNKMLLTPGPKGEVRIEGNRAGTLTFDTRSSTKPTDVSQFPLQIPSNYQSSYFTTIDEASTSIECIRKSQQRVVFKETAQPISKMVSFRDMFSALHHTVIGNLFSAYSLPC
jgi:hypothetical protein